MGTILWIIVIFFVLRMLGRMFSVKVSSSRASNLDYDQIDVNLLLLATAVIKADGRVEQQELRFVREKFIEMFGAERAERAFHNFKETDQRVPLGESVSRVRDSLSYQSRLNVLNFLFQVAYCDGDMSQAEVNVIHSVAQHFHIYEQHFNNIYYFYAQSQQGFRGGGGSSSSFSADYNKSSVSYYKILEVEEGAPAEDIKKSYRVLAKKYHPDKLVHLSEAERKIANDKFVEIQNAYACLKKQLGF